VRLAGPRDVANLSKPRALNRSQELKPIGRVGDGAKIGAQTTHGRRQKFRNDFNESILETLPLGDTQEFQNARNAHK
jgi:hypothetical protein